MVGVAATAGVVVATGLVGVTAVSTASATTTATGGDTVGTYRPVTPYRANPDATVIGPRQTASIPVRLPNQDLPGGSDYAVLVNVTARSATQLSYLSVFQHGSPRPLSSNLNFAGMAAATAVVPMSADGSVDVYNDAGSAEVLVDVLGYYPKGKTYTAISPSRFLDTRTGESTSDGQMAGGGRLGATQSIKVPVAGRLGVPSTGVAGVFATVTGVFPTQETYITAYPGGTTPPNASTTNPRGGEIRANLAFIPLGADGSVALYNNAGSTDLVLDIVGYVGTGATTFHSFSPKRFLDTRPGTQTFDGQAKGEGALDTSGERSLQVAGRGGIPATATSVVLNVTAVLPDENGFVSLGSSRVEGWNPYTVSSVNPTHGTASNLAVVPLDIAGRLRMFAYARGTDVILDVVGWSDSIATPKYTLVSSGSDQPSDSSGMAVIARGGSTAAFVSVSSGIVLADLVGHTRLNLSGTTPWAEDQMSLSDDGRFLTVSRWSGLPAPPNEGSPLRIDTYDRATGAWSPVAVGGDVESPSSSGDGRFTVYTSYTTSSGAKVPAALLWDRQSGATTHLVTDAQGRDIPAYSATLSGDGRWVLFGAYSQNGTSPDATGAGSDYAFLLDRSTAAVTALGPIDSVLTPGRMSSDGQRILLSNASSNGGRLLDRAKGTTTAAPFGFLSGNGRFVCTVTNGQLYRFDSVTGASQLLTMTRAGTPAYGGGVGCSLTADGQTAAFTSSSVQLGSMEKDYDPDVFTLDINGSVFP